jgi:hypothetical protein
MEHAQKALLDGKTSALAYSVGVDEADVERVDGVAPLVRFAVRLPCRRSR